MVVNFSNIEVVFGTGIGRTRVEGAEYGASCLSGFDVETVITDETEDLTFAIDAIVAKHFPEGNLACTRALVCDVLYKICIT